MSKTDKTRPYGVNASDSPREWHDHTDGVCDLPSLEEWRKNPEKYRGYRRCTWQPANWHTFNGFGRRKGEKFWRAEERQRKNRALRNYWKDVQNDY